MEKEKPLRIIHARAPLRINDIGGWTDTWFAKQGKVLNLAVAPPIEIQIKVYGNEDNAEERVLVHAENYGETFFVNPEKPGVSPHAFLQHTIGMFPIPADWKLEINIYSPVPASISTGTSAAVCVSLLGALNVLTGSGYSVDEIAALAHKVETEKLKQQSGIQDQICAARGGISFIDMHEYPESRTESLALEDRVWAELSRRICLIYLGKPHNSSAIHEDVIAQLESGGPQAASLEKLKSLAAEAKGCLLKGDLESYGQVMVENNECQRGMFTRLISMEADYIIRIARKYRASGWKVNGAGGQGGSLTILTNVDDFLRHKFLEEVHSLGAGIKALPVWLSREGLTAWEAK